jgi:hypothetical protein
MKTKDAAAFYFDYSAKLNDRVRTLAMTGIGIIWVFKQTTVTGAWIPRGLLWPAMLLVASLTADVLQQAYGAIIWGRLQAKTRAAPDLEIRPPRWIDLPTLILFCTNLVLVLVSYVMLLLYLNSRFSDTPV